MPQLMPLYWMYSVLMIFFILLMLIDLYYLNNKEVNVIEFMKSYESYNILYLW